MTQVTSSLSWWSWLSLLAIASGAAACAVFLPGAAAGMAVFVLMLTTIAIARTRRDRYPISPVHQPISVSDSLPPSGDTRLRILESALYHAHDAVVIVGTETTNQLGRPILYVNESFCQLTGYSRTEVIGRSLHMLRGPDSDPDTLNKLRQALDEGRPVRAELRNYRKDGTAFWVDLSTVPIQNSLGRITHWLIIQRDIERRKTAERKARHTGQLLRAIIDAFPGPISAVDRDGRYLVMNQCQADLFGISSNEAIGRTPVELAGPTHGTAVMERHRDVIETMCAAQYEVVYPDRCGKPRPWLTSISPLWMPDNVDSEPSGVRGVVSVAQDISEIKAIQSELRRNEKLFRGIFENASAGVSLTDVDGRFVSCNPAFAAMVGRPIEEVLGLSLADITHPDDWSAQVSLMTEVRAGTRDRFTLSKRYLRPNGEAVWAEFSFTAVRTASGEYEYGLGVSVNTTEQRVLEDQLRQSQKMEALGQMAGGIAHDFNNILTAILGNLALVQLPAGDPNQPLLVAVEQAAARAAELTHKLLGYARRHQLMFAPVAPATAFDEIVALLHHTLDPRINLVVSVAPGCPPVHADPTLLSQALMNLCLNARDAMPEGGTLTLTAAPVVRAETDALPAGWDGIVPGQYVCLAVVDTGTGMTDAVKARLFEPFFTTKGIGKGTGLGLPMVHGIIKQHRGWIAVHTGPGKGTKMELYLPAVSAESIALAPASSNTPPTMPLPTRVPASDRPQCVLLVDDEAMIRAVGTAILEQAGYRVLTAGDGVEAVELFTQQHMAIDLVILDVTMPRMSGRDTFRRMVEIAPDVPILFSTGYSADEIIELEGARGLLSKPYRPPELLAAVTAALMPSRALQSAS